MIYPIRYYGDPVLRRRASPVTQFGEELAELAAGMLETMYAAEGVGLAAPQVGVSRRLFVALEVERSGEDDDEEARRRKWEERKEHVIVNPKLLKREGEQFGYEGCLSLPGLQVEDVRRDYAIELEYQDLTGAQQHLKAEGFFAHVLQHEFDHLEGVLFFDRLEEPRRREFLEEYRLDLLDLQREAREFLRHHVNGKASPRGRAKRSPRSG